MKKVIAYYLLLLYSLAVVKPVAPFVCDAIAHAFSEAAHISAVHMIYGSNHAKMEAERQATDEPAGKQQSKSNFNDEFQVHLLQQVVSLPPSMVSKTQYHRITSVFALSSFIDIKLIPPEFS